MDVRELRIGNWVTHLPSKNKSTNAYFIVSDIDAFKKELINGLDADDCEPIPLTEEWLRDFDFKEVEPKDGVLMAFKRDSVRVEISHSGNFYYKNKPLPYVHLLQNVYYFTELTREELTLKNKEK